MESEQEYLKCACPACGQQIEYPASCAGQSTDCPSCEENLVLPVPELAAAPEPAAAPELETASPEPATAPETAPEPAAAPQEPQPPDAAPSARKGLRSCQHCGGPIDYALPEVTPGMNIKYQNLVWVPIVCPHCGQETQILGSFGTT